jgi:hypothetical protein
LFTLQNLNIFSEFLPLVFCFIFFRKMSNRILRVFFLYAAGLSISMAVAVYFISLKQANSNQFVYSIYCVFELITFSTFFYIVLQKRLFKTLVISFAFFLFVLGVYSIWQLQLTGIFYNSKNLFFIFCCFLYFIEKVKFVSKINYTSTVIFWLVNGILISGLGLVFFFLIGDKQVSASDRMTIASIVTIIKNCIYCFGIAYGMHLKPEDDKIIDIDESLKLDDLPESYNKPF